MQDTWMRAKAEGIQSYADSINAKCFYDAGTSPLLSADGTTLVTEKDKILSRLAEHCSAVHNQPSYINEEAVVRLLQVEINQPLAVPPSIEETRKAISLLSSGKAPGSDAIPAKFYKAGGSCLIEKLTDLLQSLQKLEAIHQEFKDLSIINLYKRKGNRQACDNHRGISLLSIAGKILARILLSHLTVHLD